MNNVSLNISGKRFEGWTGASINKSLFSMTGTFGLTATDIFPGNAEKWGLAMGDSCTVAINNQIIISGYIEDIPISYSMDSHNIQISGRDKTADLIDCSFTETSREWNGQSISKVITDLCSPFDITVEVDDSVTTQANTKIANETFKANEGDVVFDLIFKLCKMKGILPVSYGDGKLFLTGTGVEVANDILELGKNVKSGNIEQSNKERYQTYIVKGQGKKTDLKTLTDTTHPFGQHTDDVILRNRPLVIFPETSCDTKYCQDRAKWEAINRAGNSRRLEYEVQGWTQSNGEIWPLNSLVNVKDDFLQINSTLLISAINFSINNDTGAITRLTLVHPDTFILPPTTESIKKIKTDFDWKTKLTIQE
jgi:prophage tail gpP-like protein